MKNFRPTRAPEVVNFFARKAGIPAPKVLLAIRDEAITNWVDLCARFGADPDGRDTFSTQLGEVVDLLARAGLLQMKGNDSFELSESLHWVLTALDISLPSLAGMVPGKSLLVTPPFEFHPVTNTPGIFVLMPFEPEFDELYTDTMSAVARSVGLPISRADDLFGPRAIMNDIWSWLLSSRVVIADCTGRNPNVFYEIGLAHCIGRPVILIAQSDDDVPFDLQHIRYIKYKLTPRGSVALERALVGAIREAVQGTGDGSKGKNSLGDTV